MELRDKAEFLFVLFLIFLCQDNKIFFYNECVYARRRSFTYEIIETLSGGAFCILFI